MKKVTVIIRILLGTVFTLFSLIFFFNLIPPQEMSGPSGDFITAIFKTGYMMPIIKAIELICGVLLITGQFAPLTTVIIFPITLNIFLFHAILDPKTIFLSLLLLAFNLFLAYSYRDKYAPLFLRK